MYFLKAYRGQCYHDHVAAVPKVPPLNMHVGKNRHKTHQKHGELADNQRPEGPQSITELDNTHSQVLFVHVFFTQAKLAPLVKAIETPTAGSNAHEAFLFCHANQPPFQTQAHERPHASLAQDAGLTHQALQH